jgi:hypothetical protein
VVMTDMEDRLRLLQKNVDENSHSLSKAGSACVRELTWGDKLEREIVDPLPDFGTSAISACCLFSVLQKSLWLVGLDLVALLLDAVADHVANALI